MLIYFEDGQASLFDQDFYAGKMSQGRSPADSPKAKIFVSFSKKLSELSSIPYLFLDLSEGVGNLLGESYWETLSPWRGDACELRLQGLITEMKIQNKEGEKHMIENITM